MGEEAAEVMMSYLPSHPVPELLTVSRFESEMVALRGEMAELRAEFKSDIAELRAELKSDMARLEAGFGVEIGRLYRWGAAVVAANAIAMITALVT